MELYWIHSSAHSNPYAEGYIGISKHPDRRYVEHKAYRTNPHLSSAFKKYSDIKLTILHSNLSEEDAKQIELSYRPAKDIGWNVTEGGGLPPSWQGKKHSEATKAKIGRPRTKEHKEAIQKAHTGAKRSEETRLKLSIKAKNRAPLSQEARAKISATLTGKTRGAYVHSTCPHCSISGSGGNMKRYHFENCKEKL